MFLIILTLILCLTKALVFENFENPSALDHSNDTIIYNVYPWVLQLQLQRCALVAIGLKYFAIFVEDEILGKGHSKVEMKYFLGICQQEVLEKWNFCSPSLSEKRKYKCRFKLKADRFHPRVHRRFCDLKVMINNKDCKCAPSILGEELIKVRGFPTCYIPPLPNSLCTYNVCGLNQCTPSSIDNRIYTVNCSSNCKGDNPFCERRIERTSRFPAVRSFWSKWRRRSGGDGRFATATCINKYTGRGGLDCLGPGTGCCPTTATNCTCETYEKNGVLKVKRIIYVNKKARLRRSLSNQVNHPLFIHPNIYRYFRGTDNEIEELEDDDEDYDDDDDLNEDIVLEESPDEEKPVTTTEALEQEEAIEQLQKEAVEEIKNATNSSMVKNGGYSILSNQLYVIVMLETGSSILLHKLHV